LLTGTCSVPLQPPIVLDLAASSALEIARAIFKEINYLKSQWLDYTFLFSGPNYLLDDGDSVTSSDEDNGCFERSLVAYCAAYNVGICLNLQQRTVPNMK
jgi:hypothetical protein